MPVGMCGVLWDMLVQRRIECCILKTISFLFTTCFSDTKNKATLQKVTWKGGIRTKSRNVACNIFGTFSALCSEYAKLHISAALEWILTLSDGGMILEGKLKCLEKILSHPCLVHHKSHTECPKIEHIYEIWRYFSGSAGGAGHLCCYRRFGKPCFMFVCHAEQQQCLLSLGCLTLDDKLTRFLRNVGFTKRRGVTFRRRAAPLILAECLLW